MTKLYVTEYASLVPQQLGSVIPVPMEPAVVDQTPVDYSGGAAQSAAFNAKTAIVRIETDAICSVLFGTNPTATTSNRRMSAGDIEYFGVVPGSALKVSAITNT